MIGVIMAFGLGLSVLFLWAYDGRTGTSFSLLGTDRRPGNSGLALLFGCAVVVLGTLAVIYRPLLFASTDPEVAAARGVPVRALSIVFAVLVGITAALGVQIVGALLVMALLINRPPPPGTSPRTRSRRRCWPCCSPSWPPSAASALARAGCSGLDVRHHDLVRDLPGVPGDRRVAAAVRRDAAVVPAGEHLHA